MKTRHYITIKSAVILAAILISSWARAATPISKILVEYHNSQWTGHNTAITISKEGYFKSETMNSLTKEVYSTVTGMLSEEGIKELSNFINSVGFFRLQSDLTNKYCEDGPNESLEITIDDKTKRVWGYCIENGTFGLIISKLYEIEERFKKPKQAR